MTFALSSPAFAAGTPIPGQYTCDGKNISPPLQWSGAPAGTQSFTLIHDDPDCSDGAFTHWILYNLPPHYSSLIESFTKEAELPDGTLQGLNDFGKIGYGGPCPPSGTHRYFFKLYAVNTLLPLPPRATKKQLELALRGQILDKAEFFGTYQRASRQK